MSESRQILEITDGEHQNSSSVRESELDVRYLAHVAVQVSIGSDAHMRICCARISQCSHHIVLFHTGRMLSPGNILAPTVAA